MDLVRFDQSQESEIRVIAKRHDAFYYHLENDDRDYADESKVSEKLPRPLLEFIDRHSSAPIIELRRYVAPRKH